MTLKELKEQRAELLNSMSTMTENIEIFDSVKFDEMKNQLEEVENKIREFDNAKEIENKKEKESDKKMSELYNKLMSGQEINLNEIKNSNEHRTDVDVDLIDETFAGAIERKLRDKCLLYQKARKVVTASPHNIRVEKKALDKFVKVEELGQYTKQKAEFGTVKLGAVKFGTLLGISQELLDDADYDIEGVLMEMLQDAFQETVLDLIVAGDEVEQIEGLAMASVAKGAKEVNVADGIIEEDDIIDLMFAMERPYREDAIFVMRDDVARKLCKLKDQEGRPLLQMNAFDKPFLVEGAEGELKGKAVVICDALPATKPLMFVNMEKAMVVGIRKDMNIKKSEEAGFLTDEVLIKANVRIDVKLLIQEAIAFIKVPA